MWYPGPDEPTSELYRLTPPRRKPSEPREAIDVAHGIRGRRTVGWSCRTGGGGGRW